MDQKLHEQSLRAVEKALAAQRKNLDPSVAQAYKKCQMNIFLSKTVSSALLGMGVYGVLGLVGRRAPAIAQYKAIPSMFSYTLVWDHLSKRLDSMCIGSMLSLPEGVGPELRRAYAEQYSESPYLQAARDIADAAKRWGDVRIGRTWELVPASSPDGIMVATPEILAFARTTTGWKPALEQRAAEQQPEQHSAAARSSSAGSRAAVKRDIEQHESDDGFLAADNERHRLDTHAAEHSRLGSQQDSAGAFVTADSTVHYDHEASGRFQSVGSSLASSDVGMDRPRAFGGEQAASTHGEVGGHADSEGALALPSMPNWGDQDTHRGSSDASLHTEARRSAGSGDLLRSDESFALRRRLAMRGSRLAAAPLEADKHDSPSSANDFDEDEYFGR